MRLAVRSVISKREERGGRWTQLLSAASTASAAAAAEAAALDPNAGSAEQSAIKQTERRLHKLEAELRSCDRALEASKSASRRVESRLAKELYFQSLIKQQTPPVQPARPARPGADAKGSEASARAVASRVMNELRLAAEDESRFLEKQVGAAALRVDSA